MSEGEKYLKIAVRKFDPFSKAIQKQWDGFCRLYRCEYKLKAIPMDLNELHQTILTSEGLKKGEWDLAQVSSDWVPEACLSDSVDILTSYIQQKPPEEYPNDWCPSLLGIQQIENKIFGLPFHDGPECLIYRKDLFEDPQYQKKYFNLYKTKLLPPATWEEFVKIATFFQDLEHNFFGSVFALYPDGHNAIFDFCLQVWSRGGDLLNTHGNIDINTPEAAAGLRFFKDIFFKGKALHPQSINFESIQAGMAFARGEIAMMINWFGFASFCEFSEDSLVKGKIDVTAVPCAKGGSPVSLNSYWMYMIAKGSSKKDIAYEFIRFAINKENDKQLTKEGGIGCRKSTWDDKEINRKVPYFKKLDSLHQHAKNLPSVSYWPEIAIVIDDVMQQTVHSIIPVEKILENGQRLINQILSNHGN